MAPPGGGDGLAAYVLQALDDYEISIACFKPPAYAELNRFFDTNLTSESYQHYLVPRAVALLLDALPTPHDLLRYSVLERYVRRLAKRRRFDLYIATSNEFAFPKPGIQYVHYPRTNPQRPKIDYRWYHYPPGVVRLYRSFCFRVGGGGKDAYRRNLTLANSRFIAQKYETAQDNTAKVVFPPAPGEFEPKPWRARTDQFVCLGRLSHEKEVPKVIDILDRVRSAGHAIGLRIVGTWNCSRRDADNLRRLLRRHRDWATHDEGLDRASLIDLLVNSRYGIHGMVGEHFGMAVAEMQCAGCVTFVPSIGGPKEIIGDRSELIYGSVEEAVGKIIRVLESPVLGESLHEHALARAGLFGPERFMREIRRAAASILRQA
jgi:glycosyltransferase involved in cell wall biosynthesis